MNIIARYPFLLSTLPLAATLLAFAFLTDLDMVRTGIAQLQHVEDKNVDDLFVAVVLIIAGLVIDLVRGHRKLELEAQRLETLRATMRTVQDLVGNALNNLLLFRMEAEDHVSPDALRQFDEIIQQTSQRLAQLADVQVVVPRSMASGIGIQYE